MRIRSIALGLLLVTVLLIGTSARAIDMDPDARSPVFVFQPMQQKPGGNGPLSPRSGMNSDPCELTNDPGRQFGKHSWGWRNPLTGKVEMQKGFPPSDVIRKMYPELVPKPWYKSMPSLKLPNMSGALGKYVNPTVQTVGPAVGPMAIDAAGQALENCTQGKFTSRSGWPIGLSSKIQEETIGGGPGEMLDNINMYMYDIGRWAGSFVGLDPGPNPLRWRKDRKGNPYYEPSPLTPWKTK